MWAALFCLPGFLLAHRQTPGDLALTSADDALAHLQYFRIEYKSTAIRQQAGQLILSNGKGNAPLVLDWPWGTPKTVVIHWTGQEYEAIATYRVQTVVQPPLPLVEERVAGIDLGEVHMAVSHDGEHTHILNGRLLRAHKQYQNKLKAKLQHKIATKQRGSKRRKRLVKSNSVGIAMGWEPSISGKSIWAAAQ